MSGLSSVKQPSGKPVADTASSDVLARQIDRVVDVVGQVVLGKEEQIKLSLCCLLARGHLLIEDLPGMGKTTLSHALGKALGLSYQRLQFTSDLLPADVIGASIYNKSSSEFEFVRGPIFTQLLLADEVNRTTPKTQSALLEAMEERQVSVDGKTYPLPEPFFVIATQNPGNQSGTYALPESQLDRFLMKIGLGYPDADAERQLLKQGANGKRQEIAEAVLSVDDLLRLQQQVDQVKASDVLLDYLQRLVDYSRSAPDFVYGLSPRAAIALLQAARAWALIHQRNHCLPEDIQTLLPYVAAHRLNGQSASINAGEALVAQMLESVEVL